MTPRALAAASIVLLAPLAGCIADETPESVEPVSAASDRDAVPRALPDNRSGEFNAFQETNRTEAGIGGLDHGHDYWKGKDRVEIVKGRFSMAPYPYIDGSRARLYVPPEMLVYEGTYQVEVLLSKPQRHVCEPFVYVPSPEGPQYYCTDSNPEGLPAAPGVDDPAPPKVSLLYRHAATKDWIDAGPVTWGTPLVIPVAPEETDMPHSTRTLWGFIADSADTGSASTLTFEATVTAVKGREVVDWPGHPDFYADSHQRIIFSGNATTKEVGVEGPATGETESFGQQAPNRLISHGTQAVHVWANVTNVKAPPGATFAKWVLRYHNATDQWRTIEPVVEPADPSKPQGLYFQIPVDADGMDTPYATDSRWEFHVRGVMVVGPPGGPYLVASGFVSYEIAYDMTVIATDIPLEDAEAAG